MLLVSADTYEAGYTYEYETATDTTGTAGLNSKKITETKEVVKNVQETGPYYQRLVDLLLEYDFSGDERNLEFILELAATYDEDYQYSLEDRWLSLNASIDFTRSCFDSDIGTIIWPLDQKYKNISSPYGYRIHPTLKKRKLHTGY
jgi:murein DD-endopeptidase MepM/ murein hydrolase activator NlpD